ncbi:hypothetical protein GCM10018789_37710 [Streptomyces werraensis]|nr:hypothetical protein GCM10018789_37710 [Streptomyces werraensis]
MPPKTLPVRPAAAAAIAVSHTGAAPVVDIVVMLTASPVGEGRALPAGGPVLDEQADPAVDLGPPDTDVVVSEVRRGERVVALGAGHAGSRRAADQDGAWSGGSNAGLRHGRTPGLPSRRRRVGGACGGATRVGEPAADRAAARGIASVLRCDLGGSGGPGRGGEGGDVGNWSQRLRPPDTSMF